MHNNKEIIDTLIEELEEELEGIIHYEDVYNSLKAKGLDAEAKVIEAIATDEYSHACAIWDMLKEHDADLSGHEKIHGDWERVKKIFNI